VNEALRRLQHTPVDWATTSTFPYLFEALVDGRVVRVRLNDFPAEPLCTVIVDGVETDLDDWPEFWRLPRHRGE
jgi:hypothetical protein